MQDGYNADALHGDLSQSQRDHVMDKFRNQNIQILVATDVAARGIDVNELTHVINFNLPDDPEVYVHRSGRTGRAGNKGISIIISGGREARKVRDLEKLIASKIEPKNVPTGAEICEKRLISLIEKIENIEVDEELIEPYMETVNEKLANIDRDTLLKRFLTVEFNSFLEYYKNTKDITAEGDRVDRGDRADRTSNRRGGRDFSRFFINIGQKHNLRVPNLIGLINEQTRNRNIEIGKIEILRNFSFFEVDTQFESLVLESFKDAQRDGVDLDVQISKPEPGRGGDRDRNRGGDRRGGGDRSRGFSNRREGDRERSGGYRGGDRDNRGGDRDNRGGDRGGYRGGDRNRTGNLRRGRD